MQNVSLTNLHSSWFTKFVESFFAVLAIINGLLTFAEIFPVTIIAIHRSLLVFELIISMVIGLAYSIYWHIKERSNSTHSSVRHAWCRGILRYWLAFEIAVYGFAKILKTQFTHAYYRDDMLVSKLSGFELTWNYFGYSYPFSVIIGVLQIGGATLLLFRRTSFAGAMVLLPVMINILLINYFYSIAPGAFLNSILFTLGLLYLVILRRRQLVILLFKATDELPRIQIGFIRSIIRVAIIVGPFFFIYYFSSGNSSSSLAGKWHVNKMIYSNDSLKTEAGSNDFGGWKNIYIEQFGQIAFCSNPHLYDPDSSQWGSLTYDPVKQNLKIIFDNSDSMNVKVSRMKGNEMEWKTIINKDTLFLSLSR